MHRYQDLITLFNTCFSIEYNTQLLKGGEEPIYLPADNIRSFNTLFFAHGYFSSALHECSHWFIAGEERRKHIDFGYWYLPDGRDAKQQALFQQVEVKPQAIEWILSKAAGYRFRVSFDNLNGSEINSSSFKNAVYSQVEVYCLQGLPKRAECFRRAISKFYKQDAELKLDNFNIEEI